MFPEKLEHRFEADEVYPQREKLIVRFELPRGSYATIVTRRITLG
jgi:tRNA pseudouridine13 synthase